MGLIDNPARIEVPESTGPRTLKRENHMVVHSKIGPELRRGLMCFKPTDERWSRCWLAVMGDYALRTCLGGVTTE